MKIKPIGLFWLSEHDSWDKLAMLSHLCNISNDTTMLPSIFLVLLVARRHAGHRCKTKPVQRRGQESMHLAGHTQQQVEPISVPHAGGYCTRYPQHLAVIDEGYVFGFHTKKWGCQSHPEPSEFESSLDTFT